MVNLIGGLGFKSLWTRNEFYDFFTFFLFFIAKLIKHIILSRTVFF
jgi:hypothetical protein